MKLIFNKCQTICTTVKAIQIGKSTAASSFIENIREITINNILLTLRPWGKEEQAKLKISSWKK